MKILLKISALVIFTTTFSQAGLVNAISVIINDEPITLYEVYDYAHKFKISTKESLDLLIRQKLENAQITKMHIKANNFEVDEYIKKLSTKNNVSEFKFFEILKTKDIKEADYRKDVRRKLEREKLYQRIYAQKKLNITKKNVEQFYKTNKSQFAKASSFSVASYQSTDKKSLEKIRKNPMLSISDVTVKIEQFKSGKMNPKLERLLDATKSGEFTPALNTGKEFTMFYVKEKNGVKVLSFDKVKNYIYSVLSAKKRKKAIGDYFEKLKSVANVKVLRRPNK